MPNGLIRMRSGNRMRPVLKPWAAITTLALFGASVARIVLFGREWYMGNVEMSVMKPMSVGKKHTRGNHNVDRIGLVYKRHAIPFMKAVEKDPPMGTRWGREGGILKDPKQGIGRRHIKKAKSKVNYTITNELHRRDLKTKKPHGNSTNVQMIKNQNRMGQKNATIKHRLSAAHNTREQIPNFHWVNVTTHKMRKLFFLDFSDTSALPAARIAYLGKIFQMFKKWGATGLLLDYRDMFPFSGRLQILSGPNAFTVGEIKHIGKMARKNGLTVIPLVQTFSHMEFVLKHEQFQHLQELNGSPDCIMPLKTESLMLIYEMINQTMRFHPASSHIHIGSDDVVHLGKSKKSKKYMEMLEINTDMLFLRHVRAIAVHLNKTYASRVRPIIWDGMLHRTRLSDLLKAKVGRLVEPMVWIYGPRTKSHIEKRLRNSYSKVFRHLWVVGDLTKGFNITNITHDLERSHYWMRTISAINGTFSKLEGLAITGY